MPGEPAAVRDFGNAGSRSRAVSALDRVPLFIATCSNASLVYLRPRHPGQSAARFRPLPVAFLSALPAPGVHRLAAGLRRLLRRARPGDGGDVGHGRAAADPDGVSRRSLWRPPVPDRRHLADDLVDFGDGIRHRLLAGRWAGIALRGRQLGLPPGGLRHFERFDRSGAPRPIVCLSHLQREYRVRRRAARDGRADLGARLARRADLCRASGSPGGCDDPVAKPDPDRSGASTAESRRGARERRGAAAEPIGADVLRVFHDDGNGRRRHPVLADHDPAPSARVAGRSRLLRR